MCMPRRYLGVESENDMIMFYVWVVDDKFSCR